jgi:hypothetical protein
MFKMNVKLFRKELSNQLKIRNYKILMKYNKLIKFKKIKLKMK